MMPSSSFNDLTENDVKFLPLAPWLIKHENSAMEEHTRNHDRKLGGFRCPGFELPPSSSQMQVRDLVRPRSTNKTYDADFYQIMTPGPQSLSQPQQ